MADNERMGVDELKEHLGTLTSAGEVEALLQGEDRTTARKAIEDRLSELSGTDVSVPEQNAAETVYSRDELLAAATTFETTPAGMGGALHLAGLQEATEAQARSAVEAYNEREV